MNSKSLIDNGHKHEELMLLLPPFSRPELDTIYHMPAESFLRWLPDASVDLIATDPPYMGVKDEAWDNQWETAAQYLEWLRGLLVEFRRVLKPNGSLYLFASPQMAARVEVAVSDYFSVLNRVTWRKPAYSTKAEMFDKATMRAFFPASEAIVFGERGEGDTQADQLSGYTAKQQEGKANVFGRYLKDEFARADVANRQIAALFPSKTGGLTGCVSNWLLGHNIPTSEQYSAIRAFMNNGGGDYLRREYEDLRREYEDLRREYEDLRRPFNVTDYDPYTDVWEFETVQWYQGKHPCEKPLALMKHIIKSSSKIDSLVLDVFAGSGATLDAARQLGRRFVGCDADQHWVEYARRRISHEYTIPMFEAI